MITQVKHVSIPVSDYDRALKFYTEKLGFELKVDAPIDEKHRWIELAIPGSETQVVLFTPQGHEGQIGMLSNIIFTSDNIEETHKELLAKGVEFSQSPTKEPWGEYCMLKDPDGNTFCISSS